ncbi:Major facilitator superfamily domain general substrate transporter [Penicillium pulvis]|uniref:Major facilitator superfamily domain general substrate transporter n=1 Tax=Penicillium pulvis TaxID=1562058 RepID=UPI002546B8F0|nr:Major facilitator superfamily domain general substrate transporter [Penicillium pulvis]KAJ5814443.1 Major facilitator superfamily domain general substrate transporter [Penicillium pulvis]
MAAGAFEITDEVVFSGYDVSSVADIQPALYRSFGNITLLSWISLSFGLAVFAVLSISRKIIVMIIITGAAVAGAASNLPTVIVGRIIIGVGGDVVYQGNLTPVASFSTPDETPRLFGLLSAVWAMGLVIGGPIGSALASDKQTTWRWAFYMNLPWLDSPPLFFALARGHSAMQQTVRLLPFVLVFIAVVMLVGGLLPVLGRYNLIYIVAGITTVANAGAMTGTLSPNVSESQILCLEALMVVGLSCSFQHGVGVSNVINKNPRDRFDSAIVFNMAQMGGFAIALAIAGSVSQNAGYSLLTDAIGNKE